MSHACRAYSMLLLFLAAPVVAQDRRDQGRPDGGQEIEGEGPLSVDFRKYVTIYERERDGTLVSRFRGDGGISDIFPAGIGTHASEIPVDLHSSIVVQISDEIIPEGGGAADGGFAGELSVRARILRETPVELPVDNFTIVDKSELKSESPAFVPDHILRDQSPFDDFDRQILAVLDSLARVDANGDLPSPADLTRTGVTAETVQSSDTDRRTVVRLRARLTVYQAAYDQLLQDVNQLLGQLRALVKSDMLTGLSDQAFNRLSQRAFKIQSHLQQWSRTLESAKVDFTARAAECDLAAPPEPAADAGPLPQSKLADCSYKALTDADREIRRQQAGLAQLRLELPHADSPPSSARPGEPPKSRLAAVTEELGALRTWVVVGMRQEMVLDYKKSFKKRIALPAEVHLDDARDLVHGEILELTIRNRIPSLNESSGGFRRDTSAKRDLIQRFRFRAVDHRLSFSVSGQFVIVKRLASAGPDEIGANYVPTAGVGLSARYHLKQRWGDWALPSVGVLVLPLHFSQNDSLEIGVAAQVGVLNDLIHVGLGRNLFLRHNYTFWFLGLDFAQTSATLASLLGGGSRSDAGAKSGGAQ